MRDISFEAPMDEVGVQVFSILPVSNSALSIAELYTTITKTRGE